MDRVRGTLFVTPDNTAPGSEGRLYLDLPAGLAFMVGWRLRCFGSFGVDRVVMMVRSGDGDKTVTPRRQVWWKNGVRDHGIRENWIVNLYIIENDVLLAILVRPTGVAPKLPPYQPRLFP